MAEITTCPSAAELASYLKGHASTEAIDAMARHIEECDACANTVDGLASPGDTLADMVRGNKTAVPLESNDASVEALIEKLKQTPIPAPEATIANDAGSAITSRTDATTTEPFEDSDPISEIRALLAPPQSADELGRLANYRILKVLGSGGIGVVFLAEDTHLKRLVALKAMRPEVAKKPAARQRFLREAQAAAGIKHEHIVGIHSFGEERGLLFLAIEYLEGETLDERMRRVGRFPIADILRIGRETAIGLAAAHKRGLVHRDIKPANLWLEGDAGRVKVLDFGLARGESEETQLTQSGMIVGTPAYMAPEQARGVKVDARCDLFSLGVVFYRLVSGTLPFQADTTMGILTALALETPKSLTDIDPTMPSELTDLIHQLLAKKPDDRPASAQEVADRLASLEKKLAAPKPSATPTAEPNCIASPAPAAKRPTSGWLIAVGLLLALVGGSLAAFQLVFRTPNGNLIVEVSDDAEVLFKNGKLHILAEKGESKYEIGPSDRNKSLPSGKYLITVAGPDGLKLDTDRFEIGAGTKKVRVTLDNAVAGVKENPVVPVEKKEPVAGTADKEKPFVVIRKSGDKTEASTFARALELHQDGDALEVHGNGPFRVNEYRIADKALIIRAGNGYRPQFRTDNEKWFLNAEKTKLDVAGCDFRYPWGDGYLFGGSGDWTFRDCRMLVGKGSIGEVSGNSKVCFHDCLISREWQGNPWFGGTIDLFEMKGCVCRVNQPLFAISPASDSATVVFEKNTFVVMSCFFTDMANFGKKKLKVQATGNIFERSDLGDLNYPIHAVVKNHIDWSSRENFYAHSAAASEVHFDKEGKKRGSGLEAWAELWGKAEPGAKEAPKFIPLWRSIDLANSNESLINAVKPSVEAFKTKLPKLGPDWSLMGPGDAYLRALAAQGKSVPKEQFRPQTQEGAVFVVVRGDQVVKAFDQLPEASANTLDGDTIEIRTDENITVPHLRVPASVKSLTIKAAPGYRPVIEGNAVWISDGLTLTVEGLHFEGGPLDRGHGNIGDGRLARIANCSFSLKGANLWRRSIGGFNGSIQPSSKGSMEIVNCLVAGRVGLQSEAGATLTIDNSVIGKLTCLTSSGKGMQQVNFRHSILWQPATAYQSLGTLIHVEPREGKAPGFVKISVRSEDSLFDCGSGFISAVVPQVLLADWKGERNVYRFNEGPWQLARDDPKTTEVVKLSQWRNLWKSDTDSIQADPLYYDRAAWR